MKVLIVGSWHPKKIEGYITVAQKLGCELAKRNHVLVASPSSGIQGIVAKAYKENGGREFIGFFPDLRYMDAVGEKFLIYPDTPILTGKSYPVRNVLQVEYSDAVIGITGGRGTRQELEISIFDCDLPTAYYQGSSDMIDNFIESDTSFKSKLMCSDDVRILLNYIEKA